MKMRFLYLTTLCGGGTFWATSLRPGVVCGLGPRWGSFYLTGDNLLKIVTGFVKEDMTGAEGFTPQCTRHGGFPAGSITIDLIVDLWNGLVCELMLMRIRHWLPPRRLTAKLSSALWFQTDRDRVLPCTTACACRARTMRDYMNPSGSMAATNIYV
jgi:hypothetical protein